MIKADPYAFAAVAAEQIVKGLGLTALPINPHAIAQAREIVVQAKPVEDKGCSGMLVRLGNDFAIAYATHLQNEGFENFSVAHELGHYFLPGHVEALIQGDQGMHLSHAGFNSGDRYEVEADRFAAGLLMPRHLFFPAIEKAGSGLAAIEKLADLCRTSLHATAIRYTQCTRDPIAIVVSRGGVIDHCFMSETLKQLDGIDWLKKPEGVPRTTPTYTFNQTQARVDHSERVEETSNLQHWFGGKRSIQISEDIVGLGSYGKTLTVLYDIELPEPEDEEDEEQLIESWTPRFKR